jgi:hypothetical protein
MMVRMIPTDGYFSYESSQGDVHLQLQLVSHTWYGVDIGWTRWIWLDFATQVADWDTQVMVIVVAFPLQSLDLAGVWRFAWSATLAGACWRR